ncbi:MAG: hypothetical protein IPK76_06990 [Lewinellaceae bacterium]|jgi:hypothetical protein|nr:hypothetical protein [Lewinellaceae bacterium]
MLRQNAKAASIPPLSTALIREVEMEVVFGTPSKNCDGAGVCMLINRLPRTHHIPCPHAPVIIHYPPGRELVFRFRKRHLDSRVAGAYFNNERFLVEEAFRLPLQLVNRWQLPIRWIKPGSYLLEEYAREWRLYFPF